MTTIEPTVLFRNTREGGNFYPGRTYQVRDSYADELERNGFAEIVPDAPDTTPEPDETKPEPTQDPDDPGELDDSGKHTYESKGGGGWYAILDADGHEVDTARGEDSAKAKVDELNAA